MGSFIGVMVGYACQKGVVVVTAIRKVGPGQGHCRDGASNRLKDNWETRFGYHLERLPVQSEERDWYVSR